MKFAFGLIFTFLVSSTVYANTPPLPRDVQALIEKKSHKWHHALSLPSLKMGKKSQHTGSVIDIKSTDCAKIIGFFEKKYGIPHNLMMAIAKVESRCSPWSIHHNGASLKFKSSKAALTFLKTASGNVQVGCMQLDVRSHRQRFKTTEMMMTPYYNIEFAAKLLRRLHKRYGSWERAVSFYHAASPSAQKAYCRRIEKQLKLLKGSNKNSKDTVSWI